MKSFCDKSEVLKLRWTTFSCILSPCSPLLLTCFLLVSYFSYSSTLRMEAVHCSELLVDFYRTTPRYNTDDCSLNGFLLGRQHNKTDTRVTLLIYNLKVTRRLISDYVGSTFSVIQFCLKLLLLYLLYYLSKLPSINVESTDGFSWNFVWISLLLKRPHIHNLLLPSVINTNRTCKFPRRARNYRSMIRFLEFSNVSNWPFKIIELFIFVYLKVKI
jgi:hypothetical protein